MERETIRNVRLAVRSGKLPEEFTPSQVNRVPGIHWAGTFLPKHRVGNLVVLPNCSSALDTASIACSCAYTETSELRPSFSEELICPIIFACFRLE